MVRTRINCGGAWTWRIDVEPDGSTGPRDGTYRQAEPAAVKKRPGYSLVKKRSHGLRYRFPSRSGTPLDPGLADQNCSKEWIALRMVPAPPQMNFRRTLRISLTLFARTGFALRLVQRER